MALIEGPRSPAQQWCRATRWLAPGALGVVSENQSADPRELVVTPARTKAGNSSPLSMRVVPRRWSAILAGNGPRP